MLVVGTVLAVIATLLAPRSAVAAVMPPAVVGPSGPVAVGDPVGLTSDVTGQGVWDLGDGTSTVAPASGVTHTYAAAGLYAVTLTVVGPDGAATSDVVDVVVYDRLGGFVTGGGWISSPAGSYLVAPTTSGRASFGFVSRYKKGRSTPDGNTTFVLHGDGFRLKSTDLDWMVISGSRVQMRGAARLDGVPGHTFRLHGVDGDLRGDDPDRFRIQVWDPAGDLVYDNERGARRSADATTLLGGGQVVIHDGRDGAPLDQAPVADAGADVTTPAGVAVALDGTGSTDPDGEPLSFAWSLATGPDGATVDVADPSSPKPTFTADLAGTYLVRLVVSDGSRTDADTVAVTVEQGTGTPPTAVDDAVTTPEDTPVVVDVAANDTDADGDPLTVTRVDASTTVGASVELQPDGTVLVTPDADLNGPLSFGYAVSDGTTEAEATVVVTVTPVDDPPVAVDDAATTPEDTPVDVEVLANDTDADGDPLEVDGLGPVTGGTAELLPGGVLRVVPDADSTAPVILTYTVRDTVGGGTDEGTVTVTVTPQDDAAVARDDVAVTDEDVAVVVDVLANDSDPDGPVPAVASVGPAGDGTTELLADGRVRYTPTADANGTDAFDYVLVGGATATVTVSVLPAPDAPVASDDAATTPEDTSVVVDVLANDTDPDGDTLVVVDVTAGADAAVEVLADGRVRVTPAPDLSGEVTVPYTAQDPSGRTATATLVVAVTPVDDAPVAADDAVTTQEDTPVVVAVLANDLDVDGDDLTVVDADAPDGATVLVQGDGSLLVTPDRDVTGVLSFAYTMSDGTTQDTATVTVTVLPEDDPPVAVDDTATTDEDTPVDVVVLANDTDPDGDPLEVAALGPVTGGSAQLLAGGVVRVLPDADATAPVTLTYTVRDTVGGGTDLGAVTVTVTPVDDPPVALDDTATTPEDRPISVDVLANDTDVDGDPLTLVAVGTPSSGTAVVEDGRVLVAPAPDAVDTITVTYDVTDGSTTVTATLVVTVTPVDDPAVASDDVAVTDEDVAVVVDVLANDTDLDGPVPAVASVGDGAAGTTELLSDGTVRYVPDADANGLDAFSYTLVGGATAIVSVSVLPVPDAPVAVDDVATTLEDTSVTVDVLANDTDADGDALEITRVDGPTGSSATVLPDGRVEVTPPTDLVGEVVFTYEASDGPLSDTAVVVVTVLAIGDAPVATDDVATTDEDTSVRIAVLANDTDVDSTALSVSSLGTPDAGSAVLDGDEVVYTPAPDASGVVTFTYVVTDGTGTDEGLVTVTVLPANDAPVAADDAAGTDEDTAVVVDVLANDVEVDGDALLVNSVTVPAGLDVVVLDDERLLVTPAPDVSGTFAVTYVVTDGELVDTAVLTITVDAVNDAPVAEVDTATTPEDTPVTVDVLANDADVDGDALTIASLGTPTSGDVAVVAGEVLFTPAQDADGTVTFTYVVTDGTLVDTGLVTVDVTAVDDAPVAADDTATTLEDAPVTIDVLANDADVDGDVLTIASLGTPTSGDVAVVAGEVLFTPAPDANGTVTFSYVVTDGTLTDEGTVVVTVSAVDDGPVAVDDTATTPEDTPVTVDVLADDTDVDGDVLTIASLGTPSDGEVAVADGEVLFTPAHDANGTVTFTYVVTDGTLVDTGLVTVDVTAVDDAPVAVDDTATTLEDTPVTIDVLVNDGDVDGDALTIASLGAPRSGDVAIVAGEVLLTPAPNADGVVTFTYVVTDGTLTDEGTVVVTVTPVNDRPVAVDDTASTLEDTAVTIDVLADDTDVDGDALTIASLGTPSSGEVTVVEGEVLFTPVQDANGTATFTYEVSDGTLTDTGSVSVTVTPVNDAPLAVDDTASTLEDTPVTIDVLGNDTDVDGDTLTVASLGAPISGEVTVVDGEVLFTPAEDANGEVTFTYEVTDGDLTDTATVTVDVTPVDDAPIAAEDTATTLEDTGVTIDVLANDADVDGDALTIASLGTPTSGDVAIVAGEVVFTPVKDGNGTVTFTYVVTDGTLTDEGTVVVTVTSVNDAPVAVDVTASTLEDTPVTIDVLVNDGDVDGDALTIASLGTPSSGEVTVVDGAVLFTPAPDANDVVTFTYVVTDGTLTDEGTVVVTVTPVNDAPVAVDDTTSTLEDTPVTIDVIANDTDVDGDALAVASLGTPGSGEVTVVDGEVLFTPAGDANGEVTFTYEVTDGELTDTATVTVDVTPVNDAPVAAPDAATTLEDTPVTIDVLVNDVDVDGDALAVASLGTPGSGEVTVVDGEVLFTPAEDANGEVTFTYEVTDGELTDTATVTVEVTPVDDAPVAADDTVTTPEDTPVAVDVLGNDEDVDDPLAVTAVTQPASGTVVLDGGVVTFTPAPDANGPTTFTYTVTGGALTATATVTVDVTPVNDAPVAVATSGPPVTVGDGQPLTFDGSGSTDVDGDALAYAWTITAAPSGSTATLDGATTATPSLLPDLPGTYTVELVVDDGASTATAAASTGALAEPITVTVRDPLVGVARSTPGEVVLPDPAPVGGLAVDLVVDDPSVATLDVAQVTVPEGATTAAFTLTGGAEGTVTVTGTPVTTFGVGSVGVEVTPVFLSIGDAIVIGPEEQVSVPLTISQADPSDLTVQLRSLDESIATVDATSVIPGGRLTPVANPQATGVALGLTEVVVEAPGVAPDRRTIEVALGGQIFPTSIRQPVGRTRVVTVQVAAPAPSGGLELGVSLNAPVASVPATVTIPAGQLQTTFELVATEEGIATLFVDGIGFQGVQAAVRTDPLPSLGFGGSTVRVGTQLQVPGAIRFNFDTQQPTDVTVTSDDPAVLIAQQPTGAGSQSVSYDGLTGLAVRTFYVQAVGDAGATATITLDAGPLWQTTTRTVEIVDSSVRFFGTPPYEVVNVEPVNQAVVTMRLEALVAPGAASEVSRWRAQNPIGNVFDPVTVTSTDDTLVLPADCAATAGSPAVAAPFSNGGGLVRGVVCVDGIAVTGPESLPSLVVTQPPGFVASERSSLAVDVVPGQVIINNGLNSNVLVAPGLARQQIVELNFAPPAPVDITLTVPPGSGLRLAAEPGDVGGETLVIRDVTDASEYSYYVQADTPGAGIVGPVRASTGTPEYVDDEVSVNVQYPSMVLEGQLRQAEQTIEATTRVSGEIVPAIVNATGTVLSKGSFKALLHVGAQQLDVDLSVGDQSLVTTEVLDVAGTGLAVPFSGDVATVPVLPGAARNAPVPVPLVLVDGINPGTTTLRIEQPPGFVVPLDSNSFFDEDAVVVTVIGRPIYTVPATGLVGVDLQDRLPRSRFVDVPLTITVVDPSMASLTGPAGGEVSSVTLPANSNADQVAVNGLAVGDTVLELRAEGYTPFDLPVRIGESTVYLSSGLPSVLDQYGANRTAALTTGLLVPDFAAGPRVFQQPLRPLADPKVVTVVSDTPSVLAVVGSPVTVDDCCNPFEVDPRTVGSATVTVEQPPGFTSAAYARDSSTVEVVTDDIRPIGDVALGVDHRDVLSIVIDNPVPDDRTMTVRSSAPDVLAVSSDPSVEGKQEAARLVTNADGVRIGGFTLHALAPGSSQVTVQLPGYDDVSFDIVIHPSTVQWYATSVSGVPLGGTRRLNVELVGYTPAGNRVFAPDGVRPGAAVTVDLVSDDPTVAAPAVPTLTFDDGPFFQRIDVLGVAAGTTTLRVGPPVGRAGYEPPRRGSLTLTVS